MSADLHSESRLASFPVSFFAMVMGLTGLAIGWEKAQQVLHWNLGIDRWVVAAISVLFAFLLSIYLAKIWLHRQAVLNELMHPIKIHFFPTVSIGLLLLAVAFLPIEPQASRVLWTIGAVLHLLLTLFTIDTWIHRTHFKVQHMNPAWFIPAVGNVLVPVAGIPLGYTDISWFFFSIGMLFWIVLMTIVFYRAIFHDPIEARLLPTLFILIAPPAVGFIAYTRLVPELDPFARVLYYSALFLPLLLLSQAGRFLRLPFFLTWWAYSFPLAAISIASLAMFERTATDAYRWIGLGLVGLLTAIVAVLLTKTAVAVWRRAICVPGH